MKITVRAVPKSSQESVEQTGNNAYKVRVHAAAEDGKANEALIKLLARYFTVSPSAVTIVSGRRGRKKIIEITERRKS